jgi:hypothetical protein
VIKRKLNSIIFSFFIYLFCRIAYFTMVLVALALARIFLGWIKFDVDFAVLFEEFVNYCTRTGDRNSETCEK